MAGAPTFMTYLQLLRLPNSFTAVSNILAAQLIITQGQLEWRALVLLMIATLCLYSGGIVLNDCFDYDEDLRDRPSRPLPSGQVPLAVAWTLGFGLLAAGIAAAAWVGTTQLVIAVVIALLVLLYDAYAKHTPLGSVSMGACRYANWILGLSHGGQWADIWLLALPVFLYVTSLTLLARSETDASHRQPLFQCTAGLVLTAVCIVTLHLQGLLPHGWALLLLLAAAGLIGQRLWVTFHSFSPTSVQGVIKTMVLGIIPLDAILVFAGGPWWGGLLVLALYLPSAWLARKLYVT